MNGKIHKCSLSKVLISSVCFDRRRRTIARIGETWASTCTASGHVRHMAIFSMQINIWSWETYLDITCDECTMAAFPKGALML